MPPVKTAAKPSGSVKVFSLLPTRTEAPGLPNTIGRFATHADAVKTDSSSDAVTTGARRALSAGCRSTTAAPEAAAAARGYQSLR